MRLYLAVTAALAVVLTAGWFYTQAKQAGRNEVTIEQIERNSATREALRNADRSRGDADDDFSWLCSRFGIDCGLLFVPVPGAD